MRTGFHQLLVHLDPDPVRAGDRFVQLRRKLVGFFHWRGAAYPEDEADETITRLAGKLEFGAAVLDIEAFAHGIARLVLHESKRARLRLVPLVGEAPLMAATPEPSEAEARSGHLQHCLGALPRRSRELLIAYYSGGEGARKIEARRRLARRWGLTPSTLRSRVQRLRNRVEDDLLLLRKIAAPAPFPRRALPCPARVARALARRPEARADRHARTRRVALPTTPTSLPRSTP